MEASDLRSALAARVAVIERARGLAAKLAELEAQDLANGDALVAARAALDDQLALDVLGEPADVANADRHHTTLTERSRGIDRAIDLLRARIAAIADDHESAERHIMAVMSALAEPLIEGCKLKAEHHALALAGSLRLLYRLDQAARSNGGFRTGAHAHEWSGSPGNVLSEHGIRADGGALYPTLRERIDDLKPEEMLAILEALPTD